MKWANEDPNPRAAKRPRAELLQKAEAMLDKRIASMRLSEIEIAGLQLQLSNIKSFTAPYPDTSSQYPHKSTTKAPLTYAEHKADCEAASSNMVESLSS